MNLKEKKISDKMFLNIFRIRAFAHLFDAGPSWRNTTSRGTSGDGQVVLYVETDPETLLGTTGDDQDVLFDETDPEILLGTTGEERNVLAYGLVRGNTVIRDEALRLGTTDDGLVRRDSVLPDEMDSLKAQLESALQDNHN